MEKEQLIEKLKQIVSLEKFKLDAYFLCGAATSAPNQSLQKACEIYLEAAERGQTDEEITANLVAELEAAVAKNAKFHIVGDLADSADAVKEIYESRELL